MTGSKVVLAAVLTCMLTGCSPNPISRNLHYSPNGRMFAYVLSEVAGADALNWSQPSNGGHYEYVVFGHRDCPEGIRRVRVIAELYDEYDLQDHVNDIVFSPDGRYLAVTTNWKVFVIQVQCAKLWKVADIQQPIMAWLGDDELAYGSNPDCGIGQVSMVAFRKRVGPCEAPAVPIPESRRAELIRAWRLKCESCTPWADDGTSG